MFNFIPRHKIILSVGDLLILNFSYFIALKLRYYPHINLIHAHGLLLHPKLIFFFFYSFLWIFFLQQQRLYHRDVFLTRANQIVRIVKASLWGIAGFLILSFFIKNIFLNTSRFVIISLFLISIFLLFIWRSVVFYFIFYHYGKIRKKKQNVLIIGAGQNGKFVAGRIITDNTLGFEIIGFVDDRVPYNQIVYGEYRVLGTTKEIERLVKLYQIDTIIIAVSNLYYKRLIELIDQCEKTGAKIRVHSSLYQIIPNKMSVERFNGLPFLNMTNGHPTRINYMIKRIFDVVGAAIILFLLSPLLIVVAIIIKMTSKGPVLYKQVRIGKDGNPFDFYKFRSMVPNNNSKIHEKFVKQLIKNGDINQKVKKIKNDPRVTPIGRLLRKYSIDELPQLINVLKGDMSLVGPRPCLPYEYDEYDEWHKERLKAIPGCTGIWQVSGRSDVNFNDMVVMDLFYIKNMSIWFDLELILKTIPVMLLGKGGY